MIQIIITHKLYLRPEMKHGKSQHCDHWCGQGNQQENEQNHCTVWEHRLQKARTALNVHSDIY